MNPLSIEIQSHNNDSERSGTTVLQRAHRHILSQFSGNMKSSHNMESQNTSLQFHPKQKETIDSIFNRQKSQITIQTELKNQILPVIEDRR